MNFSIKRIKKKNEKNYIFLISQLISIVMSLLIKNFINNCHEMD